MCELEICGIEHAHHYLTFDEPGPAAFLIVRRGSLACRLLRSRFEKRADNVKLP